MSEILEKAAELGELIKNSPEFNLYKEKELAFIKDDEAQKAFKEYEERQESLSESAKQGSFSRESLTEFKNKMQENMSIMLENKTVREYLETKSEFNKIIKSVNDTIAFLIDGEENNGCSGNCKSCGGCG